MIHAQAYDLHSDLLILSRHVGYAQSMFGCCGSVPGVRCVLSYPKRCESGCLCTSRSRAVEGSQSCFCSSVEMSGDDVNVAISSVGKQSIILPLCSSILTPSRSERVSPRLRPMVCCGGFGLRCAVPFLCASCAQRAASRYRRIISSSPSPPAENAPRWSLQVRTFRASEPCAQDPQDSLLAVHMRNVHLIVGTAVLVIKAL